MPRTTKSGQNAAEARRKLRAAQREREEQNQQARTHDISKDELQALREAKQANKKPIRADDGRHNNKGPVGQVIGVPIANNPTLLNEIEFCLRMAIHGFDYKAIAAKSEEALGYPIKATRVKTVVTREMNRVKDPLVKEIRTKGDARLDYYLTKLAPGVEAGDVSAIHEARLIEESRRKMWGADMPANVRITGDVQHHLDPAVAKLMEDAKARQAQREANEKLAIEDGRIIEAQVVEDAADPDYRTEPYDEQPPDPTDVDFAEEYEDDI